MNRQKQQREETDSLLIPLDHTENRYPYYFYLFLVSVIQQDSTKSTGQSGTNLGGRMANEPRKKPLHFSAEPDKDPLYKSRLIHSHASRFMLCFSHIVWIKTIPVLFSLHQYHEGSVLKTKSRVKSWKVWRGLCTKTLNGLVARC